jgi:thiamine kinase-like enzyme
MSVFDPKRTLRKLAGHNLLEGTMTENTPPSLSVDPLVKDLNQSVVELRIELDELREKIRRLESEQKMVTAIHKVLAHIDSQPHEPSLKGVLKVLADELEKPL